MNCLRQSTATTISIGPFVSATDAITPQTALDVTTMTVYLLKGTTYSSFNPTASGGSNDCVHKGSGEYELELTALNTNTLGPFRVGVQVSGALPVFKDFMIMPSAVYDAMFTGTGDLCSRDTQNAMMNILGPSLTFAVADASPTASSFATAVTGLPDDFYRDFTAKFAQGSNLGVTRIITGYNGTTGVFTFDEPFPFAPLNGENFYVIAGHSHPVSQIQAGLATSSALATTDGKVDALQTSVNGLNDISQADVAAAIAAADLATGADADAIAADVTSLLAKVGGVTGSGANTLLGILQALASKSAATPSDIGGTFDPATDSVEAIRDRGDAAWTGGGGGDDPWATPLPGSYNPGEAGHIVGTYLDAKISTLYIGQTSSGSSSPLGSKSCTIQQSLDQGEKKTLKGQLIASTGTITISDATVTLQRKGSETPVYGVDDVAATGYDAGAISTVQAWFLLDTVEPTTGEGPMTVGDYILVFKITATASTDGLEQVFKVKVPIKVTTIV